MSRIEQILSNRVDRTTLRVYSSHEEADADEREFWMSCTPEERLTALEVLRQSVFGYAEDERGLQGFFEVAERKRR